MKQPGLPPVVERASWIWPDNFAWDLLNCYALFRKEFTLPSVPRNAPLLVTADQSYRLYINGHYVCRGPARGFQDHWPYDEIDVAAFLKRGKNLVAVRAYNPGRGSFQYVSHGMAGLFLAARWGDVDVITDRTWKCRRQEGIDRAAVPVSVQLYSQEHVDKRIEPDDWMMPGFNDGAWKSTVACRPFGGMPWHRLEPRMIPMLAEDTLRPRRLLGFGHGKCSPGYAQTRDAAWVRFQENRTHGRAAGLPDRFTIPATGLGRFRSCLLDFGRTVVGSITLTVEDARGGEIVDMNHTESILPDRLETSMKMPSWCRMAFANRMICRPGRNRHVFYHPFGFRFLDIAVRDSHVPLRLKVELNWIGYPLERKGRFATSDPLLARIWETCAWTQQCCALDAYVDTPWREQAQWWGDARVQGWNTFHLSGDPRLLRRGIHCIASQTTPNGLTYGHAPTVAHECILPDFTLIWMLTIWDYYWQTGSLEPLRTHRAVLDGALQYFRDMTDPDTGLVGYDHRYWLFLDWTDIFKSGYPAVYNLWLLLALDKLAELFRLARDKRAAREIAAWAGRLRRALGKLVDARGLVRDGFTRDGKRADTASIHTQTLAIMTALHPAGEKRMLRDILFPYIRGEAEVEKKRLPSSYWCTYVFSVLAERGYGREVVDFIRELWAPMAEHGTTWEVFEPQEAEHSLSHAWSAHPLFHLMQIVGGLRQTGPAWERVLFQPHFIGERGGASIPTPHGPLTSDWERTGRRARVSLALPRHVRAHVILPGHPPTTVTGTHHWSVHLPQ